MLLTSHTLTEHGCENRLHSQYCFNKTYYDISQIGPVFTVYSYYAYNGELKGTSSLLYIILLRKENINVKIKG